MKKLLGVLAAGLLVFGVAGQAKAAFSSGDIVEVVYQTTASGGTTEVGIDLGSAATATVTSINALNSSVNLNTYFTNLSNLEVAFFAAVPSGGNKGVWASDAVGSTPAIAGLLTPAISNINTVVTLYGSLSAASGGASTVSTALTTANNYYSTLDESGAAVGSIHGYLAPGTIEASLVNGSSTLDSLFKISSSTSPLFTLDATLTGGILTTTAQPNASPVPIPPSVLLLGSGLLGLVGIRRREIFKF